MSENGESEARGTGREAEKQANLFDLPAAESRPTQRPASPVKAAAKKASASRRAQLADTLPPWARAAMPLPPTPSLPPEEDHEEEESGIPERRVWRVGELVTEIRTCVEDALPEVWVRGEISNLRAAPSGHLYFTLKDGEAQLPAVMFRRQAQLLRFRPEDGLEVLLRGRVSVYEQRGQMQLIGESLEPVGAGSLQVAFEQLKRKLEAEGLLALDRKRLLPPYPHCVGIVTSPSGAVIRDFLNVSNRRHAALDILLYPAVVQGESAAGEICAGIAYFNRVRNVDVIVIARGGGSLEDLAPFNSEAIARAIAASTLPVVSAVGHETDFTIADFVADLRAPTPSAAAELITAAQHRIEEQVDSMRARLGRAARLSLAIAQQRLGTVSMETSLARLRNALGRREQKLDERRFGLERAQTASLRTACDRLGRAHAALERQDVAQRLRFMRERLAGLHRRLQRSAEQRLSVAAQQHRGALSSFLRYDGATAYQRRQELVARRTDALARSMTARLAAARSKRASFERALNSLSPLAVLGRGYALVLAQNGTVIRDSAQVLVGEALQVRLGAGELTAAVTEIRLDIAPENKAEQ